MIDIGLACLLMGLGIGIDVALVTFIQAKALSRKRIIMLWLLGVTLTHTLFPMVGYLIAYFSIHSMPLLTPVIGVIAFIFIAHFISQELAENEENEAPSIMVNVALILAVSWDALWSGPAKSAQVFAWPEFWVWFSFVIVGLVVFVFACLSLWLANIIRVEQLKIIQLPFDFGQWLQLSIIGYFGLLALLRYTFQFSVIEWQVLLISSLFIAASLTYRQVYLVKNREVEAL